MAYNLDVASNIPPISLQLLDQIGPESGTPWKERFYVRQIQVVVSAFIEQDFEAEDDLARAQKLKRFVNNPSIHENSLRDLLDRFDFVAQEHFPGIVSRNFVDAPNVKEQSKTAFVNLVLLEVVYNVEKLVNAQETQVPSEKWKKIKDWVEHKKAEYTPSLLKRYFYRLKEALVGNSIENLYIWFRHVTLFFGRTYASHTINVARNLPNSNLSLLGNFGNLLIVGAYSGLLISTFFISGLIRIHNILDKLMSIPLEGLEFIASKLRFSSTSFISLMNLVRMIKYLCVAVVAAVYVGPLFIPFILKSAALFSITTITLGALTFLIRYGSERLNVSIDFIKRTDENVDISLKDFIMISVLTLISGIKPALVEQCIDDGWKLIKKAGEIIFEDNIPDLFNAVRHSEENLESRKRHFAKLEELRDDFCGFFERNLGLILPAVIRDDIMAEFQRQLGLVNAPTAVSASTAVSDYDRNALIRRITTLRGNIENVRQEHGEELAAVLENIRNPHTYLTQFNTIANLPTPLREFAVSPAPVLPVVEVDDLDAYVPETSPI